MQVTVETVFTHSQEFCAELVAQVETRRKLLRLAVYATLSAALYGGTMGLNHSYDQAALSAVKVPVLFLLTLAICLPSLHFLGLLFGSTVRFGQTGVVLTAGICRMSILLAAFAPIALFFLFSGSDYPFLLLMHVAIFTFCGAAGLVSIHNDFHVIRQALSQTTQRPLSAPLLHSWMVLYMFVGTQMAYNLSPFVNRRGDDFLWLADAKGNFYTYLWGVLREWLQQQSGVQGPV